VVVACTVAYWLGARSKPPEGLPAVNHGLAIADQYLGFGETWETKTFPWALRIENHNPNTVEIVRFVTSCDCVLVEPSALVIPSGEDAEVKMTLDLQRKILGGNEGVRDFSVHVVPIVDSGSPLGRGWVVKGRVRFAVSCEQFWVHFGESIVRGHPSPSQTVRVTAFQAVDRLTAMCDAAYASVTVTAEDSTRFKLTVSPTNELPLGFVKFDIRIQATLKDGFVLPPVFLPVDGVVIDDIQATPSALKLGSMHLGEESEQIIVVHSLAGRRFEIDAIDCDSVDTTIRPCKNTLGSGRAFCIRQFASQKGDQTRVVRFRTRLSNNEKVAATVTLSYYGRDVGVTPR
jgi:hypothetical protein